MWKSVNLFGSGVLLAAVVAATPALAADNQPIIVGAAVALSGFVAPYDDGPVKGAQLAIDKLNAEGGLLGRKVEMVKADTKSDQAQGAIAGNEVLAKGAEMVIVTCDFDFGAAAALVATAKGKVTFSTCAADPKFGVQGIGPLAYTMGEGTPSEGAIAAEWSFNRKGWRSTYILIDTQVEFNKSLCSYFKTRWLELGGKITGEDTYNVTSDTSIAGQVTRIKSAPPTDFMMFCGAIKQGSYLRQIRDGGVTMPIVTGEANDGAYWLPAVPDLSNFYVEAFGSIYGDDPDPKVREFMTAFQKKYGAAPVTSHSMTGYSVIEAWAQAVKAAGTTEGTKVAAQLNQMHNADLLVGPTTYTKDLHLAMGRPMLMIKVEHGKHSAIERFAPTKVPPIKF